MYRVNTNIMPTLDRHHCAIWLLNSDSVITNDAVNAAIGAGSVFRKAAQHKDRPFLKFQPIARRKRASIISIFRTTEKLIVILD
ncbi:MAG: hypothetical protein QOJ84_729 [Bradyrhizobium sp.]|nr:hypothetical protein [Bradyrhizobium sp.]